ncbi:hypothetical protein VHEMI07212 [[Torrubiella] hemipterigena]|uniref:Zn(2)-C6 fungal-type domain-containing protein n=1 Tax=[Torrubiella] hemipterigena TaxID=1531966 RepID=A0A0A1TL81_9HYPO|nr:hypothetical protein VHEMI07212 [[Torrubiella] hemipterigena]
MKGYRTKRWHTKVRTGCMTCRRRRLKCDEAKPSCRRCIINRFECTYSYTESRNQHRLVMLLPQPSAAVAPLQKQPESADLETFHVFKEYALSHCSDLFDEEFWRVFMLQAAQRYPAVWHAAMAIGSAHNQQLLQTSTNKTNYKALSHYSKALQYLIHVDHTNLRPEDCEMLLLTCILLVGYCTLQGDMEQAVMHISNSIYVASNWKFWRPQRDFLSSSHLSGCVVPPRLLRMVMQGLESQLLFSPFRPRDQPPMADNDDTESELSEPSFCSALEAYSELLPISLAYWRVNIKGNDAQSNPSRDDTQSQTTYLVGPKSNKMLQAEFKWKAMFHSYRRLIDDQYRRGVVDEAEWCRVQVLHIRDLAGEAVNRLQMASLPFNTSDGYIARIIAIAEQLGASQAGARNTLSSESMALIGQPLNIIVRKCHNSQLRRRILTLFKKYPYQKGIKSSDILIRVSEALIFFEENAWQQIPVDGCRCIQGIFICNHHRVTESRVTSTTKKTLVTFKTRHHEHKNLAAVEIAL